MTLKDHLKKVIDHQSLSREEAEAAMDAIMRGDATPIQIAGFLTAMRMKGETVEEITGFAAAMRHRSALIAPKVEGRLIDTCGTGGAPVKTFNISTCSAFVASGAGIPVAKHGNRSVTGVCGSADVLEALGARLDLPPEDVQGVIERVGVGFLFAPNFHPAMKHAALPRKELGVRTIFNVLGPLTNPASAKGQVVGVFHPSLVAKLTPVLANLGVERALVVHGETGFDEISPVGPTRVGEVDAGEIRYYTVTPEKLGFERVTPEQVAAQPPAEAAKLFRDVLGDGGGPARDTVIMNAAAAAFVGGRADTLAEGADVARESVESGAALERLDRFVDATGNGGAR